MTVWPQAAVWTSGASSGLWLTRRLSAVGETQKLQCVRRCLDPAAPQLSFLSVKDQIVAGATVRNVSAFKATPHQRKMLETIHNMHWLICVTEIKGSAPEAAASWWCQAGDIIITSYIHSYFAKGALPLILAGICKLPLSILRIFYRQMKLPGHKVSHHTFILFGFCLVVLMLLFSTVDHLFC